MISVVISTKNGERYIARAIQSVFDQDYAVSNTTRHNIELIVVNDGSTDGTEALIQRLSKQDPRIRLISLEKNIGPGLARNLGVEQSKGEYIAFIDDDDYWISRQKLTIQKNFLDTHPDHVLVAASLVHIVNEQGIEMYNSVKAKDDASLRKQMLVRNSFVNSSVLLWKDTFIRAGKFKPMFFSEEYDLWLRIGKVGKIATLDDCDIAYTRRSDSVSSKNEKQMYLSFLNIIKEHHHGYPNYLYGLCRAYGRILIVSIKNLF